MVHLPLHLVDVYRKCKYLCIDFFSGKTASFTWQVSEKLVPWHPIYRSPWCAMGMAQDEYLEAIISWAIKFLNFQARGGFQHFCCCWIPSSAIAVKRPEAPASWNSWISIPLACRKRWQMVLEEPIPCLDENFRVFSEWWVYEAFNFVTCHLFNSWFLFVIGFVVGGGLGN